MAASQVFYLLLAACASDSGRRSRFPVAVTADAEANKHVEATIKELQAKVDGFQGALDRRDYGEAEDRLEDLEEALEDVDTAVITHPSYGTISTAVRSGRARIRSLQEGEASAELTSRTRQRLEAVEALIADIEEHGPTPKWLERLEQWVSRLRELADEGRSQHREPEYAALVPRIDKALATATENRGRYQWWLELRGELDKPLGEAVEAEQAAENTTPRQAVEANDRAAAKFETCVETLDDAKAKWGYDPDRTLHSPFGPMTLEELSQACKTRARAARDQATHLRWKRDVQEVADRVTDSLKTLERQQKPREILKANKAAASALADCMNRLRDPSRMPGYDAELRFVTHLGKHTVTSLHEACTQVRRNLIDVQPTLRWRIAVEELLAFVDTTRQDLKSATKERDLADKRKAFANIARRFHECSERAGALATRKLPHSDAQPNRSEIKAMVGLERTCRSELDYVNRLAKKAKTDASGKQSKSTRKRKKRR